VFVTEPVIWSPVLVCFVLFFLGVERSWFVDIFCLQHGSGCGDEYVENGGWYYGLCSGEGK
jgi:hypothetical protein